MPHAGMVWYIPSRSSLDACLQARLGGLLALVGASVRRLAVSGRRLSRRHALGSLVRLVRTLVQIPANPRLKRRLSSVLSRERTPEKGLWYGPTRGTPLLDCPCQDTPGAPHRPVLPGWSPLFAGSPCPIPHRGAPAGLTTALARGGKWSLHASPRPLRGPLSGCFPMYWEQKNLW